MSATASEAQRDRDESAVPLGTVNVFDPHPLNWLFITWNTMEEPVRTDHEGYIVMALAEDAEWRDDKTLEVTRPRRRALPGRRALHRAQRSSRTSTRCRSWAAPHPPGTYLNFHPDATVRGRGRPHLRLPLPGARRPDHGQVPRLPHRRAPPSGTPTASATRRRAAARAIGERSTHRARGAPDRSPSSRATRRSRPCWRSSGSARTFVATSLITGEDRTPARGARGQPRPRHGADGAARARRVRQRRRRPSRRSTRSATARARSTSSARCRPPTRRACRHPSTRGSSRSTPTG